MRSALHHYQGRNFLGNHIVHVSQPEYLGRMTRFSARIHVHLTFSAARRPSVREDQGVTMPALELVSVRLCRRRRLRASHAAVARR